MIIHRIDGTYQDARKDYSMPDTPQERYYVRQNQVDGDWELFERLADGTPKQQATFYDGDEHGSPLADIILSFLNAVASVGAQTKEREQEP